MPPEYPIGMSCTAYYFMVADVHVGSVGISSGQSKQAKRHKGRDLKTELAFWKVYLRGIDNNKTVLILMHCCFFSVVRSSCQRCFFHWHRCEYQMSRGNGIISTITGRSRPAVTATAWHPFGNCLAPATCRFHKPAIRQWACISQLTV